MSYLDLRDLAEETACRLESCFAVLDNLEYLCKDVQQNGEYNFTLHDDLVMLVTEHITELVDKLRTASRSGDSIES